MPEVSGIVSKQTSRVNINLNSFRANRKIPWTKGLLPGTEPLTIDFRKVEWTYKSKHDKLFCPIISKTRPYSKNRQMTGKIKIGAVPYLNVKPIIYGLEAFRNRVELYFDVPSKLPRMLERGEVDVAVVPAIECLRRGGFVVLPGVSISSKGPVESVRLFLKGGSIDTVKSVALDESSLTSAALTRIILKEKYGLSPLYFSWQGSSGIDEVEADAFLLIGDNAMLLNDGLVSLDLGREWDELTGLPFVYALWAGASTEVLAEAAALLQEAKERGLEDLGAIALKESGRLGLEPELCMRYLTRCIHYDLGEQELRGLYRFRDYALKMGLVPDGVEFELYDRGNVREGALKRAH